MPFHIKQINILKYHQANPKTFSKYLSRPKIISLKHEKKVSTLLQKCFEKKKVK